MSLTAAAAWPKLTACSRHARIGAKEIAAAEPYRLSYSKGPNTPELMTVCIGEVLDRTASLYPDKRAVVMRHTGSRFTWSELRDEVERAARGLLALGVSKGDRVGIWATNCTEWVLIQFATAKIGAILVNINPQYRSMRDEWIAESSAAFNQNPSIGADA